MCLAKNPSERIRDLAVEVGVTERAVQRIIVELETDGYLEHIRDGRRNVYKVLSRKPLRHGIEKHRQLHDLIKLIKKWFDVDHIFCRVIYFFEVELNQLNKSFELLELLYGY
jgi:DNA-binding MarR family transcriptional regulator